MPLAQWACKCAEKSFTAFEGNADFLARIDALDSGNPIKGMHFDVMLGASLMDYFAGLTTEIKGETIRKEMGA